MNYFWHTFWDIEIVGVVVVLHETYKPQRVKMKESIPLLPKKRENGKIKKFHVSSSGKEEKEVTGTVVRMLLTQLDMGRIRIYYRGTTQPHYNEREF